MLLRQWYAGTPSRSIFGVPTTICATFSAGVIASTRAATRCARGRRWSNQGRGAGAGGAAPAARAAGAASSSGAASMASCGIGVSVAWQFAVVVIQRIEEKGGDGDPRQQFLSLFEIAGKLSDFVSRKDAEPKAKPLQLCLTKRPSPTRSVTRWRR